MDNSRKYFLPSRKRFNAIETILLTIDKSWIFLCLLLLEAMIYWFDKYTGALTSFSPFYIFPVAISASVLSRWQTVLSVVFSSLGRISIFP
ncbi:hypothetical protein ACO0LB_12815 [Undibacterium sp. SXout7W]|uniref:hypothetical protein n=1 Tax=Undibacterium sp. SXout7W TaxID=3413049 RepID=UPI003BF35703